MEPGFFTTLKFKRLDPRAKVPTRAYESDAGTDLYALESLAVPPGCIFLVATGISVVIPEHTYGQIADRSSMAIKGWRVGAGVIDANFTGSVKVVLQNMTSEMLYIEAGQKIAQLIIKPVYEVQLEEVEEIVHTGRGTRGFGSSNKAGE